MARWDISYLVACLHLAVELWEAYHGIAMSVEWKYIEYCRFLDIHILDFVLLVTSFCADARSGRHSASN